VRYTRDDLSTMLRRVVVPSSLTTSSVPNKAHRRFRRFQMVIHTSISLTFILYVCYHRVCECQGCASACKPPYIALDRKGRRSEAVLGQRQAEAEIETNDYGWVTISSTRRFRYERRSRLSRSRERRGVTQLADHPSCS
jgi:hypothetical protein